MTRYIVIRILQFIPAIFLVSYLSFYLSKNSPGDPAEALTLQSAGSSSYQTSASIKDSIRARLGLNRPDFYFSINLQSDCDTLYKIANPSHRYALSRLNRKYKDWKLIADNYVLLQKLFIKATTCSPDSIAKDYTFIEWIDTAIAPKDKIVKITGDEAQINSPRYSTDTISEIARTIASLTQRIMANHAPEIIRPVYDSLFHLHRIYPFVQDHFPETSLTCKNYYKTLAQPLETSWIPQLKWNGANNQYHDWIKNLAKGNFGYSMVTGQPIAENLWENLIRSFILIFASVILGYIIAIPIGVFMAKNYQRFSGNLMHGFIILIYTIPPYTVGAILIYFFSNPDYWMLFPESGYCDPESYDPNWNWLQKTYHTLPYMVLPLITFTYSTIAFTGTLVRNSMLDQIQNDYIRTAKAKGLSTRQIIWKHAFRNALIPVVTTFVTVLPAAIGGSVIIESIFNYQGMGLMTIDAVINRDYPVLITIFSLACLFSLIASLIADLIYSTIDPRIKLNKK